MEIEPQKGWVQGAQAGLGPCGAARWGETQEGQRRVGTWLQGIYALRGSVPPPRWCPGAYSEAPPVRYLLSRLGSGPPQVCHDWAHCDGADWWVQTWEASNRDTRLALCTRRQDAPRANLTFQEANALAPTQGPPTEAETELMELRCAFFCAATRRIGGEELEIGRASCRERV